MFRDFLQYIFLEGIFAGMTIAELFTRHGYSRLCDIANTVGLSKAHLSNIWYGRDKLGATLAKRIAERSGVPLADLLYATPMHAPGKHGRPKGTGGRPRRHPDA
jgi:transcriptional regulator with XRE-family HTH domain